jgi:hypothetical protein
MAEVWSVEGDSFGIVGSMMLMPYQSPEGYQQRYPFTIIPEYLQRDVVNVFDFDSILATAAVLPSPTPTSTLLPPVTVTGTPD